MEQVEKFIKSEIITREIDSYIEEVNENEEDARLLLWENLEEFWIKHPKDINKEKTEKQFHYWHPTAFSHLQSIGVYWELAPDNSKLQSLLRYGVGKRSSNLRVAGISFTQIAYLNREEKLTEEEASHLNNSILAIYVNIFGLFDCWCLALNECLDQDKRLNKNEVGVNSNKFRKAINSNSLNQTWKKMEEWHKRIKDYQRDPFIHRVPPHVPPMQLSNDEAKRFEQIQSEKLNNLLSKKLSENEQLEYEESKLGSFSDILVGGERNDLIMPLTCTILDDIIRAIYFSTKLAKITLSKM